MGYGTGSCAVLSDTDTASMRTKEFLGVFLTIAVAKGMLSIKEETNAETHKMIIIAIPSW